MGAVRIEIEVDLDDKRFPAATSFDFQLEPSLGNAVDSFDKLSHQRLFLTHASLP
jgi:hypothetical protein